MTLSYFSFDFLRERTLFYVFRLTVVEGRNEKIFISSLACVCVGESATSRSSGSIADVALFLCLCPRWSKLVSPITFPLTPTWPPTSDTGLSRLHAETVPPPRQNDGLDCCKRRRCKRPFATWYAFLGLCLGLAIADAGCAFLVRANYGTHRRAGGQVRRLSHLVRIYIGSSPCPVLRLLCIYRIVMKSEKEIVGTLLGFDDYVSTCF